jgi:hypothetical protein
MSFPHNNARSIKMSFRVRAPQRGWFSRSWWVVTVCLLALIVYIPAMRARRAALQNISARMIELQQQKQTVLEHKEQLALALASQNDPAWVELVLLRELGVVPDGFLKVHFKK